MLKRLALSKLLHFFGTGVIDQMLLSGANFLIGVAMIRYTTDVDYGQFVLVQSTILLLTSAQNAWLAPLCAVVPSKPIETQRLILGSVEVAQTKLLRILVCITFPLPLIGYLFGLVGGEVALVMAIGVLAGWAGLQREYLRNVMIIYGRPQSMLSADVLYVMVLLAIVAVAVFQTQWHSIGATAGLLIACSAGWLLCYRSFAADPGWISGDVKEYWQEMRPLAIWSTIGASTYWLLAQSYNYVLATRLDFAAVLNINAARMIMVPVIVFTLGINNMLLPIAANWLASFGLYRLMRRLGALTLAILALDACYFALAWTFRDWVFVHVFHRTVTDRDQMVFLWGCVAAIFLLREVLQAALFALRQVKSMAGWIAVSALASLLTTWFGIPRWGAPAALIGQITGECVNLAALALMLWQQLRLQRRSLTPAPTGS